MQSEIWDTSVLLVEYISLQSTMLFCVSLLWLYLGALYVWYLIPRVIYFTWLINFFIFWQGAISELLSIYIKGFVERGGYLTDSFKVNNLGFCVLSYGVAPVSGTKSTYSCWQSARISHWIKTCHLKNSLFSILYCNMLKQIFIF